jgi:hypothetical protein
MFSTFSTETPQSYDNSYAFNSAEENYYSENQSLIKSASNHRKAELKKIASVTTALFVPLLTGQTEAHTQNTNLTSQLKDELFLFTPTSHTNTQLSKFEEVNQDEIRKYLSQNESLVPFLNLLSNNINNKYPISKLSIEYVSDTLENHGELFIEVQTDEDDLDLVEQYENEIFSDFIQSNWNLVKGKLTITVE